MERQFWINKRSAALTIKVNNRRLRQRPIYYGIARHPFSRLSRTLRLANPFNGRFVHSAKCIPDSAALIIIIRDPGCAQWAWAIRSRLQITLILYELLWENGAKLNPRWASKNVTPRKARVEHQDFRSKGHILEVPYYMETQFLHLILEALAGVGLYLLLKSHGHRLFPRGDRCAC